MEARAARWHCSGSNPETLRRWAKAKTSTCQPYAAENQKVPAI